MTKKGGKKAKIPEFTATILLGLSLSDSFFRPNKTLAGVNSRRIPIPATVLTPGRLEVKPC